MEILKLKPCCKDYIWGGHRLAEEYGKEGTGDVLAESWELSCHPDGASVIENGAWAGKTLPEYVAEYGEQALGTNCRRFQDFPILIKFIDAKDNLSIQVHPDNTYALRNEQQYGKTEVWYVMDAKEGAFLYYGFEHEISQEEFQKRIEEDTLLEVLHAVPVKKGDVFFIEAGTIHAIGKDILIAEIQQNSNVTYRVYDYGRVGKDGKRRELHVKQAIDVTKREPVKLAESPYPHVAHCNYFAVDKVNLDGETTTKLAGNVTEESFVNLLILDGAGTIENGETTLQYKKGDSFFLPAGSGSYTITGTCDGLMTRIPAAKSSLRIGIDIGGTDVKVGIVNKENELIAAEKLATNNSKTPEGIIEEIGTFVLKLLEEKGIPLTEISGVGIGVPGTVDRKLGEVLYANNLRWENVHLTEEMAKYIPLPVHIANDADCGILGEMVAGAGKGYKNLILLTLGTGVGGGIIFNGELFTGSRQGGTELGHMSIKDTGRKCTCGRVGCLEAYASATALRAASAEVFGESKEPKELFEMAQSGDVQAKALTEQYIHDLGTGIINIVNLLRPECVLLGGGIAAQGDVLLNPIRERLKEECYGGDHGEVPELIVAELGNKAGMIGAASLC